ncbi:Stress responsive A/B Barrel Domain [Lutibacter oricola]|uniref:Stress responsive A/B Barrel Domain n=1 Tax=Lutibacter oricola TaxID=762486 RepID=A0A1H3FVN3_9FLAO|nr:Dabb family protein [Lutibacter oricola]SDX94990.1 Stress responsive A/B Barrel Domain [Lutibacter oricola]
MKSIKSFIFISVLFLSQICLAQTANNLMIYRQDFKSLTAKNTVSITSYEKNGAHYVYTGGAGNIDVFNLDKEGALTTISTHELYKQKGPARGLVADNINGTDFLFVGNKHGDAVEVFKILNDGSLKQVFMVKDSDEVHLQTVITLQVIHMKKASYLFVGGLERKDPGLTCFKIHNDGKLTHIQSIKDTNKIHTDGIIGMFTHKINGKTYLYTGGFQDNGVSSFRVYENGKFKNVNNISDNTTDRYLTGAYPVTGTKLGENYYVVVGHRHHKYYHYAPNFIKNKNHKYHGDGVSVFKINKKGALVPHFVLKDDENNKLQGQTRIEIVSSNGKEAIFAVGTRDDAAIQLLKLDEEGVLSSLNYLETGYSIYYGLRSHKIDGQNFLLGGSNRFDFGKVVSYKLAPEVPRKGKVLRHIVNLKYKANATKQQIIEAEKIFVNLKNEIPEIANIEWGINDSTEGASKGFTHTFTLTFKNEHSREVYLFHKAHLDLVKKIGPIIADAFVMDYWTE